MKPKRILIAEDEDRLRRLFEILLGDRGYELTLCADGAAAWEKFQNDGPYDLLLTDLRMPKMDGSELLKRVKEHDADLPVVVITAFGTIESAVDAMRAGASDYLTKPFEEAALHLTVERALTMDQLRRENRWLKQEVADTRQRSRPSTLVATSRSMQDILQKATAVAPTQATVLLTGESGTGKEVITRFIHEHSNYADGPFVALNCAAIPDNLLESELFGHEKGSFTGASEKRIGRFEQAHRGTLFLDEIGEMDLGLQAKVLRALETREFQRVGGTRNIRVDVRIIAATNQNLAAQVKDGKFRSDLYYRLQVFPLALPPLRNRRDDIVPLAEAFLQRICRDIGRKAPTLSTGAIQNLQRHAWPGNVRELQNAVERAVILFPDSSLPGEAFSPQILNPELDTQDVSADQPPLPLQQEATPDSGAPQEFRIPSDGFDLERHEKELLEQALGRCRNNKSKAARMLGLSRATLRYRLEKFGLGTDADD